MTVFDLDAAALRAAADLEDPAAAQRGAALHPQFRDRWSPRALADAVLAPEEILLLLEAARWAPSCFNEQPWRFAWVRPASPAWAALCAALIDANRLWASRAGALIAVASRSTFEQSGQPHPTHAFDAGAAWMSLALQARHQGLVAHAMRGFDVDAARQALALPDAYDLWAIVAVGRPGRREDLPEAYQARETPSPRKPLDAIAFADGCQSLHASP